MTKSTWILCAFLAALCAVVLSSCSEQLDAPYNGPQEEGVNSADYNVGDLIGNSNPIAARTSSEESEEESNERFYEDSNQPEDSDDELPSETYEGEGGDASTPDTTGEESTTPAETGDDANPSDGSTEPTDTTDPIPTDTENPSDPTPIETEVPQTCTPTGEEVCDGMDNDCDGRTDEDLTPITCGLGECQRTVPACINGVQQDCVPLERAEEICGDNRDNNCGGSVDEGCTCNNEGQERACGSNIGVCHVGIQRCFRGAWSDCEGSNYSSQEICDGLDNDCDGRTDENCGSMIPG